MKGAHIKVDLPRGRGTVELAVRPASGPTKANPNAPWVVLRPVFSSTPAADVRAAIRVAERDLADPAFRDVLLDAVQRGRHFLRTNNPGIGREAELTFLEAALRRMGAP